MTTTDDYDDNPEWTEADFARARPAAEVLTEAQMNNFKRKGGRPVGSVKADRKEPVSLRLDQDVLAYFKAGGPGWQTRINETLVSQAAAFHVQPSRNGWSVRLPRGEEVQSFPTQQEAIEAARNMAINLRVQGKSAKIILDEDTPAEKRA